MEIGEPVSPPLPTPPAEKPEPCKRVYLHAFSGPRDKVFLIAFKLKLENSKEGGPEPTLDEVLIYTGHVGVSFEAQSPIYGFNPDSGSEPVHQVLDTLKGQGSYPGHVTDDTSVFNKAKGMGLTVVVIEYVYPESDYNELKARFDAEKASTNLRYGFPGGGDCNCATFPGRIGLPVPEGTGNMRLYMPAAASALSPRRMGLCDG